MHYSHVGQAELQAILLDHANYPAQMTIDRREDGAFDVQFQWVQAVRGRDVFGDVRQDDFLTRLKKRGEMTGAITGAWIMAASLAVILNAHRLNIDTERLGDISTWALPDVESLQPDPSGARVPKRRVLAVAQFPSVKAKKLLRVLQAQPLAYQVVRQKGSHRKLEAPNHPAITFAFHDSQTIRPSTVKDILCNQVGLAERDALALL